MSFSAWIFVTTLVLVFAALLAPWHVRLTGRTAPWQARAEVRLLAGLAPPVAIPLGRRGWDMAHPRKEKRKKHARSDRRRRVPAGLLDLALGILRAVRLGTLTLRGRIGLEDPADTGILWGRLAPFVHALSGPRRRIDVAPDFTGPRLDLEGRASIVVSPPRLLRAGLAFAWANALPARQGPA